MRTFASAALAFAKRYAQSFKQVWAIRAQLDPPARTADELAFLPAQLELIETPVSPKPKWAMRLVVFIFLTGLLWALIGKLDIVAVAPGKTIVGTRSKIIQSLESAVVKAIHVRDGQRVKAGDLLIELDSIGTEADARKASEINANAGFSEARYEALLEAIDQNRNPKPLKLDNASPEQIETENRLVQSQYRGFVAQSESLSQQIAQRQAELATTNELIQHLHSAVKLASERKTDLDRLLKQNYVARHEVLAAEQTLLEAERDLTTQQSRIKELDAAIATQNEERKTLIANFRREVLDGLKQARELGTQSEHDESKFARRDALMRLSAPVSGTVQQLKVNTVGGVVASAEPLLVIVPEEEPLEVEAMVLNKDIGFVRDGQEAVVKIDSFPYTRYGSIDGTVTTLSHDAIQDDQLGLVFQARVQLSRSQIDVEGVPVHLTPGMNVSVEIKTGQRRVIDYLLSPLQQHTGEAMRER